MSDTKRIDDTCIKAIDDIIERVKANVGVELDFTQGSMWLGKKYFRDLLAVIPFSEIESAYNNGHNNKPRIEAFRSKKKR